MCAVSAQNRHEAKSSAQGALSFWIPVVSCLFYYYYFIPGSSRHDLCDDMGPWNLILFLQKRIKTIEEKYETAIACQPTCLHHRSPKICSHAVSKHTNLFVSPAGKEAPAGGGGFPGGQSNQLPGSRHHHGGAAALDVPPHPQGQAAGKRQPAAATDLQRGALLWGTALVFPRRWLESKGIAESWSPAGKYYQWDFH